MNLAAHSVRIAKSTKSFYRLKIFAAGAMVLFAFCFNNIAAKASDIPQIEALPTGTSQTLNNAVITEVLSNPNLPELGVTSGSYWEFLVYTSPAGGDPTTNYSGGNTGNELEVFATKATGNTIFNTNGMDANTPMVGDNITITNGNWSPFNSIPEIGLTSGTTTYMRNSQNGSYVPPAPVTVSLDQVAALTSSGANLDFTKLGNYVTISDVLITGASPVLTGPGGSNEWDYGLVGGTSASAYNTTATAKPGPGNGSTNSVTIYEYQNDFQGMIPALGGQVIPTVPVDITGLVDVFSGGNEILPFAVTPHIFSLAPFNPQYWYANKPTQGGGGTWDNTSNNWNSAADGSNTNTTFSSGMAVFGGSQAMSNVQIAHNGVVAATGINIASNGYTISGVDSTATLTVGTSTTTNTIDLVDVNNPTAVVTANITAQLVGSNGLNINGSFYGPGVLILNPSAGSENFSGDLTLTAGTLQVSTLGALGTTFLGTDTTIGNKLWLNGGGLKITTANTYTIYNQVRSASGSGTLDLPSGSTLNIAGTTSDNAVGANAASIILPNAITLNLTDLTGYFNEDILHGLTFNAAAGGGSLHTSASSGLGIHYISDGGTSGTNTIYGNVDFGAYSTNSGGDIYMSSNSSSTTTLAITGNVLAQAQELYITGSGTVDMQGNNSLVNYTASTTHAAMAIGGIGAAGPTIDIHNVNTLGGGTLVIVDSGALNNVSGSALTFASTLGLSIGSLATSGVSETFAGSNMEFPGLVSFYKGNSGYLGMTVNNTTTFSDGLQNDTTGTASPLGVVLRGSGTLNISNQHGGAMSDVVPLIVTGGLQVNIGAAADGVTPEGTGFTAMTGVQVEQGTVTTKIASAFASTTNLILGDPSFGGGGTFATGGLAQSMNYLDLQASSTIDLGASNTTTGITFAASSSTNSSSAVAPGSTVAANAWASGAILRINNWKGNATNAFTMSAKTPFVVTTALVSTELAKVHFTDYLTGANLITGNEVVPKYVNPTGLLILGDVNDDGHVNANDITSLEEALTKQSQYFTDVTTARSLPTTFDAADLEDVGDINGDGKVNNADLQLLENYLISGHGSLGVPEPSSVVLGLLGAVSLAGVAIRRRRQASVAV